MRQTRWLFITVFMLLTAITNKGTIAYGTDIIYVDADIFVPGDGSSWAAAYNDLEDALDDARVNGCDEIWVAEGIYTPSGPDGTPYKTFEMVDGVKVYGGFAGLHYPYVDPDTRDIELYETIIGGVQSLYFRNLVTFVYHGTGGLIDGFTIKQAMRRGIYVDAGLANISNCKIVDNYGNYDDGGIYVDDQASVNISNCHIRNNSAGIHHKNSNVTITSCLIEDGQYGIFCEADSHNSSTTVQDSTIQNNNYDGIYCKSDNTYVNSLTAQNCTISGNCLVSSQYAHAGVYGEFSELDIKNCRINDNNSPGIYSAGRPVIVSNCEIEKNDAEGIFIFYRYQDGPYTSTIENCLISENGLAFNNDYGINLTLDDDWVVDINNCTVVLNREGGIAHQSNYGVVNIKNCIVWLNEIGGGDQLSGYFSDVAYCCIQGGYPAGTNIITDYPEFILFSGPEGPTDFHIKFNSPCVDKGDPTGDYTGQTDIDGKDRVVDGDCDDIDRVDIGADEVSFPTCWNWSGQCYGDCANNDLIIDLADFQVFKAAFGNDYPHPDYDPCADFDKNGLSNLDDFQIFKAAFQAGSVPDDCPCGGEWPPQPEP